MRLSAAAALAMSATTVLVVQGAFADVSVPVLGSKAAFQNGKGFGAVKPREVYLGGDPTGDVQSISWHHWGSQRSVGFGRGWCPGQSVAAGHPCTASLHVYGLGRCHGRHAYLHVAFYFKNGRHWSAGSRWNICTGGAQL